MRTANVPQTALRIGKDRIGKERRRGITPTSSLKEKFSEEDKRALAEIAAYYNLKINPKSRLLDKAKDKIKLRLSKFSIEEIKKAIDNFSCDEWKMKMCLIRGSLGFFIAMKELNNILILNQKLNLLILMLQSQVR